MNQARREGCIEVPKEARRCVKAVGKGGMSKKGRNGAGMERRRGIIGKKSRKRGDWKEKSKEGKEGKEKRK